MVWYNAFNEMHIGQCGPDMKECRIDSCILLRGPDFLPNFEYISLICLEIKCSLRDLHRDNKFEKRYLKSGFFDYYFVVGATDEIAMAALNKYEGVDCGVASLASGRIYKLPVRKEVAEEKCEEMRAILQDRRRPDAPYKEFCRHDRDFIPVPLDFENISDSILQIPWQD